MNPPFLNHSLKVLHCAHHRAGSTWLWYVMDDVFRKFGRNLVHMNYWPLSKHNGDSLFATTSEVIFDCNDYVGSHMVRDPRDILVSAYHYHLWTHEGWAWVHDRRYGTTYHEFINGLPKCEGMHFELRGYTANVLKVMSSWNYNNPRITEVKYEDFLLNPDENFVKLFTFWGIDPAHMDECLAIARSRHMTHTTGRKVGEVKEHEHIRSGAPGQWKEHFDESHRVYFKAKYGKLLIQLGYEKDYKW